MAKGCYRNCVICGKEFFSVYRKMVCSEECKQKRDRQTTAEKYKNAKIREAKKKGENIEDYEVHHYHYKVDKKDAVNELREMFSKEEKKLRTSCMFCKDVNSKNCGISKFEGRATGGRWTKIPDGRCRRQ